MTAHPASDFVNRYAVANDVVAARTLVITLALHAMSYATASDCLSHWMWMVLWTVFRSLVILRTFVIFHDCGHDAFFTKSTWNTTLGTLLGVEVATPFLAWRSGHRYHHQTNGDLTVVNSSMMGISGDTIFFTKRELSSMSKRRKIFMRIVRDPWVFFTVLPAAAFFGANRFASRGARFVNAMLALKLAIAYVARIHIDLILMEIIAALLTAMAGFCLFHIQHGTNRGYRAPTVTHDATEAALKGATYFQVPTFLKWATLGIEYHHIHHLNARVPCYALQRCHEAADPALWADVNHVGLVEALGALSNTMWDEDTQTYVPFDQTILQVVRTERPKIM